jgi:hypothetical protein
MAAKLTLKEVIADLKEAGWDIRQNPDRPGQYYWRSLEHEKTERDLYKLHKSVFRKGRSFKATVKKLSSGRDRAATRDAIISEHFDDIPPQKRVKEEDPWAWD